MRKVRQVGDGEPSRRPSYFATVDCETVRPSFSNSPWMRGAPQTRAFWRLALEDGELMSKCENLCLVLEA